MVLARHSAFTPQDFQKMMGLTVGFDTFFDRFFDMDSTRDSGYPPYNIRKLNEVQYVIEVALAGFSKDDIEKFCWMAVHEHKHGVLPSEYDIREIDEKLYLQLLKEVKSNI